MALNEGPLNFMKGVAAARKSKKSSGVDSKVADAKLKKAAAKRFNTPAGERRRKNKLSKLLFKKWLNVHANRIKKNQTTTAKDFNKWLANFMGKDKQVPVFAGDPDNEKLVRKHLAHVVDIFYTSPTAGNKGGGKKGQQADDDTVEPDYNISNKAARQKKLLPVINKLTQKMEDLPLEHPERQKIADRIKTLSAEIYREAKEIALINSYLKENGK